MSGISSKKTMDLLFDGRDAQLMTSERVPQGCQLVHNKTGNHGCYNKSVDLKEYRCQQGNGDLCEHQEMKQRFLITAQSVKLDGKVISKACE